MARPDPDPRQVVAVFEARHYDGLTFGQLVEWTNGHTVEGVGQWEWDPISRGTAHAWYRQALQWWIEHERLTPDEEYAGLRVGLDYAATEVVRQYRRGDLDVKTFAELSIKLAAEIRTLTGAGRGNENPGVVVAPSIAAQTAIDEMKARREEHERTRTRKRIG